MRASKVQPESLPEFTPILAAICKECGNGTLNNDAAPAFTILQGYDEFEDQSFLVCRACGSIHLDIFEL